MPAVVRRATIALLLAAVLAPAWGAPGDRLESVSPGATPALAADPDPDRHQVLRIDRPLPGRGALHRARRYARGRAGDVAFAAISTNGRLRCHRCRRHFPSASVVKAMLLVADLKRLARAGQPLRAADRGLLDPMIRESSNEAADAVYARTGDGALLRVARRAGMRSFAPAGYWSEAGLTAADQARFFARISELLPRRHRAYGRRLLHTVVAWQSWGVAQAARSAGWRPYFKGGWRPSGGGSLVHQAARLERGRRTLAIAVLTDGSPSHEYGTETIRGIAARLLRPGSGSAAVRPRRAALALVERRGALVLLGLGGARRVAGAAH